MSSYSKVFARVPGRTNWIQHDVDVGEATPVKPPPYRVCSRHIEVLWKELKYMLDHNLITPCTSAWSSPVTLQLKPDGSAKFFIDYRRMKALMKTDTYPLPRLGDCIDQVGSSRYITKIDVKQVF